MRKVDECPACARSGPARIASLDASRRERFLEYDRRKYRGLLQTWLGEVTPAVVRCRSCGHCWYPEQPEPKQLSDMYAAAVPLVNAERPVSREPTPHMVAEMTRLRAVAKRSTQPPTLLDYGSGFGRWARAAAEVGFKVTAYEPSVPRGDEKAAPFELTHSLEALEGRRFDAIQLEQVLEHVPNPLDTVRSLAPFCHADTVIRCTVPNVLRSHERGRIWDVWPFDGHSPHTLAPFEHLHGFTPRSLKALYQRAGFSPVTGATVLRQYPLNEIRRRVGVLFDSLGTTSVMLRNDSR